ncbi:unnamed protein product [Leuciscus chuanchicus]
MWALRPSTPTAAAGSSFPLVSPLSSITLPPPQPSGSLAPPSTFVAVASPPAPAMLLDYIGSVPEDPSATSPSVFPQFSSASTPPGLLPPSSLISGLSALASSGSVLAEYLHLYRQRIVVHSPPSHHHILHHLGPFSSISSQSAVLCLNLLQLPLLACLHFAISSPSPGSLPAASPRPHPQHPPSLAHFSCYSARSRLPGEGVLLHEPMKKMLVLLCLWRLVGVFGDDEVKSVSVREGHFVTLNSDLTEMKDDDVIQWRFGDENTLIAEINKRAVRIIVYNGGRFGDRLKLDNQTGSLTITNTRTRASGLYKLQINNEIKSFSLTVIKALSLHTLEMPFLQILDNDLIQWRIIGDEITLIAEINKRADRITVYDDVLDGRFRDRLKLDNQTGSLTITNTTTEHAGGYKLQINSVIKGFGLTVYADVVVATVCSSVVNVSHVTLSWYKGISVLSSISASDLSISLSLPLEEEYQDKKPYSCVLNNPISNQTTHLDINTLCHTCSDEVKSVSVKEGDSVSLNSPLTEMKDDDVIQWRFGYENPLIAEINKRADRITVYDDVLDGRFRDRLKLDNQTGSLTITNTTTEHEGGYELLISSKINGGIKRFRLAVIDEVKSVSVKEGDSVSLNSPLTEMKDDDEIQWRFGDENTLIAEINKRFDRITVYDDVLDGRFRDRLKLDNQTGSLTITNTRAEHEGYYKLLMFTRRRRRFSSKVFRVSVYDSVHCCGPTEAVIRLVLSALVGVATVIIVVYEIRSRRAERDQAHIHTSGT